MSFFLVESVQLKVRQGLVRACRTGARSRSPSGTGARKEKFQVDPHGLGARM